MLLFFVHTAFTQESSASEGSASEGSVEAGEESVPSDELREEEFVFADNQNVPASDDGTVSGLDTFGVWDLLRMVLVLLVVIGAIYGVIALLRRRVGSDTGDDDSPIRILASRSVGAGQEIHAVMIGRQVLVLGGGDGGLHLITRVEDQETIDELVLAHSSGSAGGRSSRTFGAVLGQWLGNMAVPGSGSRNKTAGSGGGATTGDSRGLSFLRAQQHRLRNLR